ncbi:MAG: winged helix-turn-helix domain-containing protein [Thermoplasmata archaeon]
MRGSAGRYRTKIEVLRDLVRAASTEERKTRIIGMANLNQSSFYRYSSLAVDLGLVEPTGVGLSATPAGEEWLGVVNAILMKGSEVSEAIENLGRLTGTPGSGQARGKPPYNAVQLLARLAWADLKAPSGGISGGRTRAPGRSYNPGRTMPGKRPGPARR